MLRGQREREKERKKKRNARKETATRITHVSPSLRGRLPFFSVASREKTADVERERFFKGLLLERKKERKKEREEKSYILRP
tara:strand:- start:1845 stop:2090 length:246 start_codon:yes stop_codon:yes gene_type:complete